MSVAILNISSFKNVRETLLSPSVTMEVSIRLAEIFGLDGHMRTPLWFDQYEKAVNSFVNRCYFFNHESYRFRYEENVSPIDVPSRIDLSNYKGEVTSLAQLFTTLHCIEYNADVTDGLGVDGLKLYEHRDEFTKWYKQLQTLSSAVAEAIAWNVSYKENCYWF